MPSTWPMLPSDLLLMLHEHSHALNSARGQPQWTAEGSDAAMHVTQEATWALSGSMADQSETDLVVGRP